MSTYFDKQANPELFAANGKAVFTKKISFGVEDTATKDDIITCPHCKTKFFRSKISCKCPQCYYYL